MGADLARVRAEWTKQARVWVLPPRLVTRGVSTPLALPEEATERAGDACTTVLALGAPHVVFSLAFDDPGEGLRRDFPLASSLGVIELVRCGARKATLAGLSVDTQSPRAVVSLLIAHGAAPAPSSLALLPHRHPGPVAPAPELGPRPMLAPISERIATARRIHLLAGAIEITEGIASSSPTGAARASLPLAAGCHTFEVLDASPEAGRADVDARILDRDGRPLVQDSTVTPDSSLSFCLGEPQTVVLEARGVDEGHEVAWVHAVWPLAESVPIEWGPRARGRLADALRSERHQALSARPLASSLGVQGQTRLATPVEPGHCYLAAVAALDRQPEQLGLAAHAGGRLSQARARGEQPSAAVTVCATGPLLTVEVQSRGAGASWILGVWEFERSAVP